jgi:hypothetical protein
MSDPEKRRASWRAYYRRHHEERLAQAREYDAKLTPEQKERRRLKSLEWRRAHPERVREYNAKNLANGYRREWAKAKRERDPEAARRASRATRIKRKYGITIDQYEAMLAAQDGLCAICHRPERLVIKGVTCTLAVDHDGETGRVRGLLCVNCNMLIGGAHHDPAILEAAIAYLGQVLVVVPGEMPRE